MTVQSPIERARDAPSAIDDGRQAFGPVQGQFRALPAECWMIAAFYLASIAGGGFAAIKIL